MRMCVHWGAFGIVPKAVNGPHRAMQAELRVATSVPV